ncbi:hypothetical protein ACLQ18_18490 [Streptomyces sp. DT193]|uniref:hypothetical protein n=1 Tax=Streptomyces sp. DT193 TaxID=3393418 RepID=UPI003CE9FAB3
MNTPITDLSLNLLSAGIGATAAYTTQRARAAMREKALEKNIGGFFGNPRGKILVVHSSIFDESEHAFNYPATDTRATRILAKLFEQVHLREGVDFFILPDREVEGDSALRENHIVALCGPARNECFRKFTPIPTSVRYGMEENPNGRGNVLTDRLRHTRLYSSRQEVSELGAGSDSHFDYGLIASLPNHLNLSRRLILLAGVHGTGTVGAAQFVANLENLKLLHNRRTGDVFCEVVRVNYRDSDIETPTEVQIA